ncbi:MAG: RagB/SusD family nutrient uptake outer membrane protein, partial [Segetibacter sp.]
MKNKIVIFSLFASSLVVILYSCKRDFLEVAPLGTYNQPQLTNKQGVNGMLISTYAALGGLQGTQLTGASNWAWGSISGGEAYKGTEPTDFVNINAIMRYEVQPSLPNVLTKWNASFEGIGRANQVLRSVAEAKDLSDAEKSQIIGEARFLRGHYHFELKKIWNNIPFVDETHIPLVADFKIPNMDASGNYINIWPQIEADLKFAYDNLDEAKPNRGRANKWAAASFLAKAYMFQNKFAEAKALFDLIIANGKNPQNVKYDLTPNYQSNFRITQENNSETVFAIQYSYGDGSNTNGNYDNSLNYP